MEAFVWYLVISSLIAGVHSEDSKGGVPAMFVFGDSLLDPGNNNRLISLAKANFPPFGIDFSEGTTGRFCNGGTIADHLGNLLGLPLIPPFNDPNTCGSNILKGVNYASAAAGILSETGRFVGEMYPLDAQITNFREKTSKELKLLLGKDQEGFLAKSLFFLWIGSNDFLSSYLLPFSIIPLIYSLDSYNQLLIQEYSRQLKELYRSGARKFLIAGLGPLGCSPYQRSYFGGVSGDCVGSTNNVALQFNTRLKNEVLHELSNNSLPGSSFLFWDTYATMMHLLANSSHYGFRHSGRACCGGGRHKGQVVCLPLLNVNCPNRSEFVFWDPFHPTDALNAIGATQLYNGFLRTTYPMSLKDLLQL